MALPGKGKCVCGRKRHTPLFGKDSEGRWRSSAAKQYASGFCRVLADGTTHQARIEKRGTSDPQQLDEDVEKLYVPLDPYYEEHVWGAYGQDCMLNNEEYSNGNGVVSASPSVQDRAVGAAMPLCGVVNQSQVVDNADGFLDPADELCAECLPDDEDVFGFGCSLDCA